MLEFEYFHRLAGQWDYDEPMDEPQPQRGGFGDRNQSSRYKLLADHLFDHENGHGWDHQTEMHYKDGTAWDLDPDYHPKATALSMDDLDEMHHDAHDIWQHPEKFEEDMGFPPDETHKHIHG
jgi:hypothetical protein